MSSTRSLTSYFSFWVAVWCTKRNANVVKLIVYWRLSEIWGSERQYREDESHEVSTFLQPDSTKKLYGKQIRETIMVPIWPWLWVFLCGKSIFMEHSQFFLSRKFQSASQKWWILGFGQSEQIKEVYNFPRNVFPWKEIKQGKTTLEDILSQS